jgi:hypothetical protein
MLLRRPDEKLAPKLVDFGTWFVYFGWRTRMDRIIKDRTGRPQGIVRQMADGREELLSNSGHRVAYYDPHTDATYKPGGYKIGSGNRLVGIAGEAD